MPKQSFFILLVFFANSIAPFPQAQADEGSLLLARQGDSFILPEPGTRVHLSPPLNPSILKGIKVHPDNPFRFDFILDKGDSQLSNDRLKNESRKLIKYFLASLTIPENDLWVNLSPYEIDRIIPNSFGLTEMGRDLLAEDYMLKQITASLIYPEDKIGKKFWKRIYEEAAKRYGTTNIPVNTFNKVWIVPGKAVVYENAKAGTAYVVESKLKVMLEQDYVSLEKHSAALPVVPRTDISSVGANIIREIVIPELNKEVNENKDFARLRQVYNSLILAIWYKKKIKDSILSLVYVNNNKIAGVQYTSSVIPAKGGIQFKNDVEGVYQEYLKAFKKGVYNYIKEEAISVPGMPDNERGILPRKYFSGGVNLTRFGAEADKRLSFTTDDAMLPATSKNIYDVEMDTVPLNKAVQSTPLAGRRRDQAMAYSENHYLSRMMREEMSPRRNSDVLILGTGQGGDILTALRKGARSVVATEKPTDIPGEALEAARQRVGTEIGQGRVTLVEADLLNLPPEYQGRKFDHIYMNMPSTYESSDDPALADPSFKLARRLLSGAQDRLKEKGTLEVTNAETPDFLELVYEKGWEPAVIKGINMSRQNHTGVMDYPYFILVPQRNKDRRGAELSDLLKDWRIVKEIFDEIREKQKKSIETGLPMEQVALGPLQPIANKRIKNALAGNLNDALLVKAIMTIAYQQQIQTPDVRVGIQEYADLAMNSGSDAALAAAQSRGSGTTMSIKVKSIKDSAMNIRLSDTESAVLKEFGISGYSDAQRLLGGWGSMQYRPIKFRAHTDDNRNGKFFVLRRLAKKENEVLFIVSVINRLKEKGLPVPALLKDQTTGKFFYRMGDVYYLIEEFLEDGEYVPVLDLTPRHFEEIGRFAARIHHALGGDFQAQGAKSFASVREIAEGIEAQLPVTLKTHYQDTDALEDPEMVQAYDKNYGFIKDQLRIFLENYPEELPTGIIFNDLHAGNLKFNSFAKIVGLIDFDMVQSDQLMVEFNNMVAGKDDVFKPSPYSQDKLLTMLRAYNKEMASYHAKLSDKEIKAVIEIMRLRLLIDMRNHFVRKGFFIPHNAFENPRNKETALGSIEALRSFKEEFGSPEKIEQFIQRVNAPDEAMASSSPNDLGGIDLTDPKFDLHVKNGGEGIKFHLDPAMLHQLENTPGFAPVVIKIQKMTDLRAFLTIP